MDNLNNGQENSDKFTFNTHTHKQKESEGLQIYSTYLSLTPRSLKKEIAQKPSNKKQNIALSNTKEKK